MKITNLKWLLLFCLLTSLVLSGCSSQEAITVTIESDIELYMPTMSSVQGFTLTAKISPSQNDQYSYHWSTNSGSFITLLRNLDQPLTSIVTENGKVLWTPDYRNTSKTTSSVYLVVKNQNDIEVARDTIEFVGGGESVFILKK